MPRVLLVPLLILLQHSFAVGAALDWPMLAHDAARSGTTTAEVRPPFERKWYRLFTEEGLMSGVQPVVAQGKVFVGALHGVLHALDAETGRDVWTFQAGGAVLHTCAVADRNVIFGSADGGIYAVQIASGKLAWRVQTGAAVWNAPAIDDGLVIVGSRDHKLYALDAATGKIQWTALTDGPLLGSPAIDHQHVPSRVYIGSEDMRVYAFDRRGGQVLWRSEKLPGVSLRGYHPVAAPDGSVLVTVAPGLALDTFQAVMLDMVREIFGDFASWRHKKEENAPLREANFKLMEKPETYRAQLSYLRQRLTEQPAYQTFFVLDPTTGRQKFVTPVVYAESMNGPGAPALVLPDGKVVVKFQALLRSRYEHYSPFLNVGYLDTATGHITPLMDQSRTYGWHDSLLLVHDEQCQLSAGGRVLINTHQDNVNGLDLDTLQGLTEPFCRNIHEPRKGQAVGLWSLLLRGQPLPMGQEWLARGTAVYGGGSVLDVPVSIVGDSFYYLPTHEISSGAALIAYRMKAGGSAGAPSRALTETLSDDEWRRVQQLPWDWDTLQMPRLTHVLEALPGKVPGTRQQPLTNEAAKAMAALEDAELDRIIWEASVPQSTAPTRAVSGLKRRVEEAMAELLSASWRPLLFPCGKFPEEAYRFFNEPTETLYTLALAYPHLAPEQQRTIRQRVAQWHQNNGPLDGPTGQRTFPPNMGELRSAYDPPPEKLMRISDGVLRSELARLYPLWLWANVSGDWRQIERDWPRLRPLATQPSNKMEEDCRNGYLAGLIAYCRMARHAKDDEAMNKGIATTRKAMRERLLFEFAHTRGGLIWQVPKLRSTFSRWHFLTPELARLLAQHAQPIHRDLMNLYVDHHRPTWWLAWNVETMMRNECPYEFPTMSAQVFAARSLILGESVERLMGFLDLPWCKADLYYIQKLALTLDTAVGVEWIDVRKAE
jgi:hypothetical protein